MAEASIDSMVTEKDGLDEGSSAGNQDSLSNGQKDEFDEGSTSKSSAGNHDSLSNGRITIAPHRRSSVGSNHIAGTSSLRNSAEKSESTNSSKNVVPHYLRASTGSCHDLCKFGRPHSFENKIRKPFVRKKMPKPLANDLSPIQILVPGGKKKDVVSDGKKMQEVVSGGQKKPLANELSPVEILVQGGKKKEVVSDGKKMEEVVSGGQKAEEVVVSIGQNKPLANELSPVQILVPSSKKKEVVSNAKKMEKVVSGGQKAEEVVSIGQKKEEVNQGPPTDKKDRSADQKPSPVTKSSPAKPKRSKTLLDKEKATKHNLSTLSNNHSPSVPSSQNKSNLRKPNLSSYTKTNSSKQNDSSGKKTILPRCKPSSAKKSPSADPPEIVKSVLFPYTVEDSVKQGSSIDNTVSGTVKKIGHVAKQRSPPVKLKTVKVKSSFPSNDSDVMLGKGRSNSNSQTGRKGMTSKASEKKILAPPSATLTSKLSLNKTAQVKSGKPGNLKLVSPPKDRSRIKRANSKASNGGKVIEKILHVIGDDNAISSPPSPPSAESLVYGKSSPLLSSEVTSESEESAFEVDSVTENNDSLETGKEAPVKENHSKTMRKSRVVVPEDKHVSAVKVKFRMGKVVDLQSDNNTPRRLRFRRARVLGAEDSKSGRKNLKKVGVNGDMTGTEASSQKVVLKHQAVQGKKDDQGLLNNVIEQAASKLVESRKSKVKALVGAFETVISLHETKPSTQVVN